MWLNLASDRMSVPQITDYASGCPVDRFSVLDGVARVRVGGGQVYAMRIWLDRRELAARGLTVADVESALRAENLELSAGAIDSEDRLFFRGNGVPMVGIDIIEQSTANTLAVATAAKAEMQRINPTPSLSIAGSDLRDPQSPRVRCKARRSRVRHPLNLKLILHPGPGRVYELNLPSP